MPSCWLNSICVLILGWFCFERSSDASEFDSQAMQSVFATQIKPLITSHCIECHNDRNAQAEIDLSVDLAFDDVRRRPSVWIRIREMLDSGQMPPKESKQLKEQDRIALMDWVRGYLKREAASRAGDPGRIALRRLNNTELKYTVQDLTGVLLDPTREFPGDNAAGEGFTNTGIGSAMSPTMVTKYLDAAKGIADHIVLTPDAIRFSPSVNRSDWSNECLSRIRDFYRRFSDNSGATKVNLQGIHLETNQGGRLPILRYLKASVTAREPMQRKSISLQDTNGESLSPKYLSHLVQRLSQTDDGDSYLLEHIRHRWREARSDQDVAGIATEIGQWQDALWKSNLIGHVIQEVQPTSQSTKWQETVEPFVEQVELRHKLVSTSTDHGTVLYLSVSDASDGNEQDWIIWENPRFISTGKPDVLLKDLPNTIAAFDANRDLLLFGVLPDGAPIHANSLCLKAPCRLELRVPKELVEGYEFVVNGKLLESTSQEASVQMQLGDVKPAAVGLLPTLPIVLAAAGSNRNRWEKAVADMHSLFPAALCYEKIVPVDEVVTLALYYREDDALQRLMLDDLQIVELNRLWDDLLYVSQEPLLLAAAFEQLAEYATQDRPDKVSEFAPLRQPILNRADSFRKRLVETESSHVESLIRYATRAYRRDATASESQQLRELYASLRKQELSHEQAIRLAFARILVAPSFLFKLERPSSGTSQQPITAFELATRLSYFLWSSMPDEELMYQARSGALLDQQALVIQVMRMLRDPKSKRLALEFACQWLHIRDLQENDQKSETLFPTFAELRPAMLEETVLFFEDLFRNNQPVISPLTADHSFLNEQLAKHYGMSDVKGPEWRRVDGVGRYGRGGILSQASTLATQSGASRTSPILRGNWICEVLLGDRLPRPPKDVPKLPDDVPAGRNEREMIERHSSDPACAKCHSKIDPLGFSLEQFDAIGRYRKNDTIGRKINAKVQLADGTEIDGVGGLRDYIANARKADFLKQFQKKLLGFALGRAVLLSDEPLLESMLVDKNSEILAQDWILAIVTSRQFREIRGQEYPDER